jgi:hypothetical protein
MTNAPQARILSDFEFSIAKQRINLHLLSSCRYHLIDRREFEGRYKEIIILYAKRVGVVYWNAPVVPHLFWIRTAL